MEGRGGRQKVVLGFLLQMLMLFPCGEEFEKNKTLGRQVSVFPRFTRV